MRSSPFISLIGFLRHVQLLEQNCLSGTAHGRLLDDFTHLMTAYTPRVHHVALRLADEPARARVSRTLHSTGLNIFGQSIGAIVASNISPQIKYQ
jgi:hypothetical protein